MQHQPAVLQPIPATCLSILISASFILVASTLCHAQTIASPFGERDGGEDLGRITRDLNERAFAIERAANRRIDSMRTELGGVADLKRRVALLEEITAQGERARRELRIIRYNAGADLLAEIESKAQLTIFLVELSQLGDRMSSSLSLWRDPELRNTWDELGTWGTIIGGVVAATAPVIESSTNDRTALAVGGGLIGVAQLLGRLFGSDFSDRAGRALEFATLSRAAYDDALERVRGAEAVIARDTLFVHRVASFRRDYATASDTTAALYGAKEILDEYESMLRQVPDHLTEIERALSRYEERFGGGPDPANAAADIPDLLARVRHLVEAYNAYAAPMLRVTPEARRAIEE